MQQVWLSNTNTYNAIAMTISTLGYGASNSSTLLKMSVDSNVKFSIKTDGSMIPGLSNTADLGSANARWRNIYTGDLHLVNDYGNWTVVEIGRAHV